MAQATDFSKYTLFILLAIMTYLSYLVLKPFLSYLLFSVVLVVLFSNIHKKLLERIKDEHWVSIILVLALILMLVVPSIIIVYGFVVEAPTVYAGFVENVDIVEVQGVVDSLSPWQFDIGQALNQSVVRFRTYLLEQAGTLLTGVSTIMIGLFLMFFVMYYLFIDGERLLKKILKIVPLSERHKNTLTKDIYLVIHGTIRGQLVLGVIQGVLGGIVFLLLGLDNVLFWMFVMTVAGVIPFIGAFAVWFPVSVYMLLTGDVTKGVILIVLGLLVISQIDNFLRPYIVSRSAPIHPAVVLVGVLGGLVVFGVIGFVTGPLILALFVQLLQFFSKAPVKT